LDYTTASYTEAAIIFREVDFLLAYFVKLVGFFSLCLFFGMLLKRSAFALAFLFVLYIVEWIAFWGAYEIFGNADDAFKVKKCITLRIDV
jgi:ABC-2 type transport system permease protein